jgi:predicted glycoside hydrolase/deacetylase ChbG (UPF0249 family)
MKAPFHGIPKQLVINADDFGWDKDTCQATIDCMEAGSITSATIMTDRPATEMACEYAVKNAHRFSFGLHFNIVDQHRPLTKDVDSLIDPGTGLFRDSGQQRKQALLWRLDSLQLQQELLAQLGVLSKNNVKVSHIDSHGHLHKFPNVISALKKVLDQGNIKRVRRPQNLFGPGARLTTRIVNGVSIPFFRSLTSTTHFLTISSYKSNWFRHLLAILPNGITELAVHPGYVEPWRNEELRPLLDKTFSPLLAEHGIQLINFSHI